MSKKCIKEKTIFLGLNPEAGMLPPLSGVSIKKYAVPDEGEMGVRVLDNYAEEHQM